MLTFTVTIHSLRGGTGKTLISINLAAFLAKMGYRVVVIDMDIGAPSLQTYIRELPKKRINDFFNHQATLDEILVDASYLVGANPKGSLLVGLANDRTNFVSKLEDIDREKALNELYKLINLVKEVLPNDPWNADFIILDTSPGFSKDSLNCVAASDHLILMLRLINADLGGTGELLKTLHLSLKPISSLIINQVPQIFMDDGNDEYTRDLINKHIVAPVGSDRIQVAGFITNDEQIINSEAEFAMYFLEGEKAQRPVHAISNPHGFFATNIQSIADYVVELSKMGD